MTSNERVMRLLASGVPLTLLLDLALAPELGQLEQPTGEVAGFDIDTLATYEMAV